MKQDPYKTLGVERCACQDEIRKAYRKLARRYHPDASGDPRTADQFSQVTEAYQRLSGEQTNGAETADPPPPYRGPGPAPFGGPRPCPGWWVVDGAGPFWSAGPFGPPHPSVGRDRGVEPLIDPPRGSGGQRPEPLIGGSNGANRARREGPPAGCPVDLKLLLRMLRNM